MMQPALPLSNVKSGELAFVMSLSSFSALAALQRPLLEVWCLHLLMGVEPRGSTKLPGLAMVLQGPVL